MTTQLIEQSGNQNMYGRSIRAAARGLWSGALLFDQFFDAMMTTIRMMLPRAWAEGAAKVGVTPAEYTPEERVALARAIQNETNFIAGFADAIEQGSKANGGAWAPVKRRSDLWVNRYTDITNRAMVMAGKDKKLRWDINKLRVVEKNCVDALRLAGRVYRASTWKRYGIRPQSPYLECGGWKCACGFTVTTERATPGRPPRLSGQR